MCVPIIEPECTVADAFVGSVASNLLEAWAKAGSEAAAAVMKLVVSGWVYVPSGTVSDAEGGPVAALQEHTEWIVLYLTIAAFLFAGLRMAFNQDGREARDLVRKVGLLILIAGAGVPVIQVLTEVGDSYSTWIINRSADGQFGQRMEMIAAIGTLPVFRGADMIIVILGVLVALSGLIQLLLMVGRSAALILLAGLLPVVAAGSLTGQTGEQMRNRYLSWVLAMLLYKPAAATVYAAAFWAIGTGDDAMSLIIALALFIAAVFALPALMRLIAPAVSAVSSSGGGAGLAAVAAGGALASGAIDMAQSMGRSTSNSGGGSGGQGGGGPTGAGQTPMPSTPQLGSGSGRGSSPGSDGGGGSAMGATPQGPTGAGSNGSGGGAMGAARPASGGAGSGAASGGATGAAGGAAGGDAAAGAAGGPVGLAVVAGVQVAKAGVNATAGAARRVGGAVADGAAGEGAA